MKKTATYILPIVAGILLLFIPLLRDFHFESAMLAGTIGCFWAGLSAASHKTKNDLAAPIHILGCIYLAALPLLIHAIAVSCFTFDGAAFWLLTPVPSVLLGTAVGRLYRKLWIPFPKTFTVLTLLFCAAGILLWEFWNFPQVYFYNHVWGVWPGPIYDESVSISSSYLYFRSITFLWIILLWVLPSWSSSLKNKSILAFTLISLCISYLNLSEMGVISPEEDVQTRLGSSHSTQHFDLYYDAQYFSPKEVEYWALKHEWYFEEVATQLDLAWPEDRKIESYLYPHPWVKKNLVGAKYTSYVPIWLRQDQLHIAKQQLGDVLEHELVHVLSKQFGNTLFNGSWSIGLIEGVAESVAGNASRQSTLHQIVASETTYPSAKDLKSALSLSGFYADAGAVSYTTAGSFVRYLLSEYPVSYFKQAYSGADIENHYPVSFEELVSGWHQQLENTVIDSVDKVVSELIFAQRSLFEKQCPHTVSTELRLWDDYHYHLADRDTAKAYETIDQLYRHNPVNNLVHAEWARTQLRQGAALQVAQSFGSQDTLLTSKLLQADAFMLLDDYTRADSVLQSIAPRLQASDARNFKYSLPMRADSMLWHAHVDRRYKEQLPGHIQFQQLNLPNKILSLAKAAELNRDSLLIQYSKLLLSENLNADWFDIYEQQIDQLIFLGHSELAREYINRLEDMELRARFRERLQKMKQWHQFMIG
ncbi:MAG: hypothetical protein FH748_05355 [Balneolaceae bacterium]|nr:hypothetical protein [Balneolaceae bacterium]